MDKEKLEKVKADSIKRYTENAEKGGYYDSFVVKCIENYSPKKGILDLFK